MAIFRVLHSIALRSLFFSPVSFADHCADWSCMAAVDTSHKLGGEVRSKWGDLCGKIPTFVPGYDGYLMGSTLLWLLLYCCWLATKKNLATPEPNRRGSQRSPRLFCKDVREPGKSCGFGIDRVYRRDSVHKYIIYMKINFPNSYVQLRSITDAN